MALLVGIGFLILLGIAIWSLVGTVLSIVSAQKREAMRRPGRSFRLASPQSPIVQVSEAMNQIARPSPILRLLQIKGTMVLRRNTMYHHRCFGSLDLWAMNSESHTGHEFDKGRLR
ncbi:MAG: hypothetical protein IPF48_03865 [Sphingomonadales bacterium]|nr:hypothetical protein [Sphingomonadales bacterium]